MAKTIIFKNVEFEEVVFMKKEKVLNTMMSFLPFRVLFWHVLHLRKLLVWYYTCLSLSQFHDKRVFQDTDERLEFPRFRDTCLQILEIHKMLLGFRVYWPRHSTFLFSSIYHFLQTTHFLFKKMNRVCIFNYVFIHEDTLRRRFLSSCHVFILCRTRWFVNCFSFSSTPILSWKMFLYPNTTIHTVFFSIQYLFFCVSWRYRCTTADPFKKTQGHIQFISSNRNTTDTHQKRTWIWRNVSTLPRHPIPCLWRWKNDDCHGWVSVLCSWCWSIVNSRVCRCNGFIWGMVWG